MRDSARARLTNHASSRVSEATSAATDRAVATVPAAATSNAIHSEAAKPSLNGRIVHLLRFRDRGGSGAATLLVITPGGPRWVPNPWPTGGVIRSCSRRLLKVRVAAAIGRVTVRVPA